MPTMSTVPADWHYVATAYEFRINPQSGAVPVEYYHVAFTPPAPLGKLANYHKAVILWPAVRGRRRDAADPRRQPRTPGCAHRSDGGATLDHNPR
jgi:hypothetical protein